MTSMIGRPREIMTSLKAPIAELSRFAEKELGFQWPSAKKWNRQRQFGGEGQKLKLRCLSLSPARSLLRVLPFVFSV